MRPRFQADADLSMKIVTGLRLRESNVEFRTARESRILGLSDPDVLKHAANTGLILVSHDEKTMPGHLSRFLRSQSSPGVIIVPQRLPLGAAIDDLLIVWTASDAVEWRDHVSFLPL
ncbi:MAG: DUF5615 family PIN-like protein [Acidobacteria bacterium]|nr:DUF5615 family PIN-like protein [Acidobacteriota bacterium]